MESYSCSIGKILQASCHNGRERKFSKTDVDDIAIQGLELLRIRAKIENLDDVDVCNHYLNQFLHEYSKQRKKCADPFASHQVTVKTTLHEVTLDEYKELLIQNFDILPGQKLCRRCFNKLFNVTETS